MHQQSPSYLRDLDACVAEIIARVGKRIALGIPLGIGKPNPLVNALYRRAKADPTLRLEILTAITLEKPQGSSELEKRFLKPLVERLFGNYLDLDYADDSRAGRLPANVSVAEFFFQPGRFTHVVAQQQNYISSNYTHAARDLMENGLNVLAQMVAAREVDGEPRLSFGSNPEITLDLLPMLEDARRRGQPVVTVAQVNRAMPFMYNDAMIPPSTFDLVLDHPEYDFQLFGAPNLSVKNADYLIGLQASALVRDGGTLQIGIGGLGDAIVHFCRLRHQQNPLYRQLLTDAGALERHGELIGRIGGIEPFDRGLYGASEMFVEGFLHLYQAGILKRAVYDDLTLQRLLNEGAIGERVDERSLQTLLARGAIRSELGEECVEWLKARGILNSKVRFEQGDLRVGEAVRVPADLARPESYAAVIAHGLGERLEGGVVLHGGFFLGPAAFYDALRALPEAESRKICMTTVRKINHLYGNEDLAVLQRRDARFINTTMMVTLMGAAVSDGLESGVVISGVGGQYNFVAMAHELPEARSILLLRSTRESGRKPSSNIVWSYGHITIPRHLRDIVITEYGIADLRGRSDKEVIIALLNIADSRFQPALLEAAKRENKLPRDYQIPPRYRNNTPERVRDWAEPHKRRGLLPDFPLGTDFTEEEIVLEKALSSLKRRLSSKIGWVTAAAKALAVGPTPPAAGRYLSRLQLERPSGLKERALRRLVVSELIAGGQV
ncbi:MAG TPA: acetyl-CoA hydrolase [Candidatus Competibacteraceae bacterium]|nr:acetyl-CoA hydrolase [Candidatus Competibacteraceae bacterium]